MGYENMKEFVVMAGNGGSETVVADDAEQAVLRAIESRPELGPVSSDLSDAKMLLVKGPNNQLWYYRVRGEYEMKPRLENKTNDVERATSVMVNGRDL